MSTYILNPNDTIVLSDSIIVKMTKAADACQMCVNEVATNWADVEVVKYICMAAVAITLIVVITVLIYCLTKVCVEQRQKGFDNEQKKADNEHRCETEMDKHNESEKGSTNSPNKTDNAMKILKEIASMAKSKDCKTDKDTANELYKLYSEIKENES
ncbi:MAG: hypothetical protein J1E57_00040 [Prevotella sp.]|nr:hypothetical protein [Prevotella sp.]